ncbi:FecR family protein [Massilibacteroides sp.]|uniref:FecR family protein n=1 Tax=Massilibacteroides sp. TaxID=2034766 RepID=UPI0026026FAA|nr:FecR family protein [Massilibacteroides sp.]MDD4514410.1 FecR family protein [Massilibacteroides sp.]
MMEESLLIHYIEGKATTEEKRQVILWLNESPEHQATYLALRKLHDLSLWNETDRKSVFLKKNKSSVRMFTREFAKIASVLLVGVLLSSIYFLSKQETADNFIQTITVPPGQRAEIRLSDDTEVWLNAGSKLSFPEKVTKDAYEVTLQGEAYFKVSKRKEIPFIVHAGMYDINVLGTEFNVKSYQKHGIFEAALLEGKIDVVSEQTNEKVSLKPSEQLILSEHGLEKTNIEYYDYFRWREGLIIFEKEKVGTLFAKLELYYDIQIQIENKSLLESVYTGKFRIQDGIEHVLRVLQLKHNFSYIRDEEANSITIR